LKGRQSSSLRDVSFYRYTWSQDTDASIVSGTGLFACQLAKNVFKAGKVITTVSTAKVPKIDELLGTGVVDESMNPSSFSSSI
jgi:hypothetical protein